MNEAACPFCGIASGAIPASIVHEDEELLAFRDIAPVAPTHVLLIPRRHIASALELGASDAAFLGRLFATAARIAGEEGIAATGYRLVTNVGRAAGQSVEHLHFHLLGGRRLTWPPG